MGRKRIPGAARNGIVPRPPYERVMSRLRPVPETGCLEWDGWVTPAGYGQIPVYGGGRIFTHRAAYEGAKGAIPEGLTIDHLCRNKRCCNPDHLEAVTSAENTRRENASRAPTAVCLRGHAWTEDSTYILPKGTRSCRACRRERDRKSRRARNALRSVPGAPQRGLPNE